MQGSGRFLGEGFISGGQDEIHVTASEFQLNAYASWGRFIPQGSKP